MRPEDVETVRSLVHARSGVVIDPGKTYQIETRLAPVARRAGRSSGEAIENFRPAGPISSLS